MNQMGHTSEHEGMAFDETFRIGELAREFDVTLRTLRFYEDKGLINPRRVGNLRLYSRADRARLRIVLLGKRVGFSLKDIREILELYDPSGGNRRQLEVSIEKGETHLRKLHHDRKQLDNAIGELDATIDNLRELLDAPKS